MKLVHYRDAGNEPRSSPITFSYVNGTAMMIKMHEVRSWTEKTQGDGKVIWDSYNYQLLFWFEREKDKTLFLLHFGETIN